MRLGDILVKHAKITDDQLAAAVHKQSTARGKKLGEILVGMGAISQADLERYMQEAPSGHAKHQAAEDKCKEVKCK